MDIQNLHSFHGQFQTVRVLKKNQELVARKIAVIDGVEQDYGREYSVIVHDGDLPLEGDYPLSDFENVFIAAHVYPRDYMGEMITGTGKDILRYKGNEETI